LLALIHDEGNVVVDGKVRLTEAQARGILELRLQRLTGLERDKIQQELSEVAVRINELLEIISSRPRRMEVLCEELARARAELVTPRVTDIADYDGDQDDESLIEPGQMVVTITREGFIKRTPLDVFRAQNRGGRGRTGAGTRGDDIVVRSFNAHTHQWVMFFSSGGKVYREKIWRLPEAGPTAKGVRWSTCCPILARTRLPPCCRCRRTRNCGKALHLVFATASGGVRRNRSERLPQHPVFRLIAMKLDEGDSLIGVATCREGQDVFLATRGARCIRFQITDDTLRVFAGRGSSGCAVSVWPMGDRVISLAVLNHVEATVEERSLSADGQRQTPCRKRSRYGG
jgi:DNA gyrase subunit A